jgi:CheY-like chemotaxis protein
MIIMDIKMPVMDGLTASKEIRLLDSMIPIIALTSDKSPEIKAEFAEIEICELMYKPINQDLLYQLIRRCLLRKAIFSLS